MANQAQATFWTDVVGQAWVDGGEDNFEALARDYGERALDAADIRAGERVLDVGCGTGRTTLEIARRVGPTGLAIGVDISPVLLSLARKRAAEAPNVELLEADAQAGELPSDIDVVYSRFGTMFFEDAVAAHANLRGALRAEGRLACACWQAPPNNPWMMAPMMGAAKVFELPGPPPPDAPSPFSLADPTRVRNVLEQAGFQDIEITEHTSAVETEMLDDYFGEMLKFGPTRDAYEAADEATRGRVFAAMREAIAPFAHNGSYRFPSAGWIVTAHA